MCSVKVTPENPNAKKLFEASSLLLRKEGRIVGGGFQLRRPVEQPISGVLILSSNFDVNNPRQSGLENVRVSMADDKTYISVNNEGEYAECTKTLNHAQVEGEHSTKIGTFVELTEGLMREILGS